MEFQLEWWAIPPVRGIAARRREHGLPRDAAATICRWVFRPDDSTSAKKMDFSFNPYNLLAGFIFGTIGWGAWRYGKRLELWQPQVIGVALMVYPYLFANMWLLWGIGVGLLVTLWFYHDE